MAHRRLEPHQRSNVSRTDIGDHGGGRAPVIVSEGGVNALILQWRKPEARQFKTWLTDVVIPAIRKDGGYILGEENVATGDMSEDELAFKAMGVMQRKIERLAAENTKLIIENDEMREEPTIMDEFCADILYP